LIGSYVLSQIQVLAGIITGSSGANLSGAMRGVQRSSRDIKMGSAAAGRTIASGARGFMRGANRLDNAAVGMFERREAQKLAMQREVSKNSQV
jgi:hypothetical protein